LLSSAVLNVFDPIGLSHKTAYDRMYVYGRMLAVILKSSLRTVQGHTESRALNKR